LATGVSAAVCRGAARLVRRRRRRVGAAREGEMKVRVETSSLKHSRWYGHVLRFCLGGTVTVAAGLVAEWFGPAVGGILLAFPAIMPAALILLERSQNEQGPPPGCGARGRRAVVLDAAGAAMGSIGLLAFAFVVWGALVRLPTWL